MQEDKIWDILIIGGGPAGLAAALYAARAMRSTLVLEAQPMPGGQIATTGDVEDYPGIQHTTGPELSKDMREHAEQFGAVIALGQEVIDVDLSDTIKSVQAMDNMIGERRSYRARSVILATGAAPRKLGLPGEDLLIGRGLSYCAVCDGPFFRDRHVAVIGGGDAAFDEGLYLTKYASRVTIIHRRDEFRAQRILVERATQNPKVDFIMDTVVDKINGDGKVDSINLRNLRTGATETLELGGLFVYIGSDPKTDLFNSCVSIDRLGFIESNESMGTDCDGVFVAGDVRRNPLKQVVTAAADGSIAALTADHYLNELELGLTADEAEAVATSRISWQTQY